MKSIMTRGIHHITAIASDARKTVQFYTQILGLRLVKKSVNQDDVKTYHLFFGDRLGHPGMDLTFFIFQPPRLGVPGNGLVTTISFAVPMSSLSFWKKRFDSKGVTHEAIAERFGQRRMKFEDSDGNTLELVGVPEDESSETRDIWVAPEVPKEHAVRSFYAASLNTPDLTLIDSVLKDVFGYTSGKKEKNIQEYTLPTGGRASRLEVIENSEAPWGQMGAGTVHHIAFRAYDTTEQLEMRTRVIGVGLQPTEIIDRFYFQSVYFRTRSGILFEIATDGPGFTADEKEKELGTHLALPPFLEINRKEIEENLPKI